MFEFELEKGSRKFVCPNCSQKTFVFYVSNQTGANLSFDVGRCNRESKCGYHYKPKQFFADNPTDKKSAKPRIKTSVTIVTSPKVQPFDFIAPEHLTATLCNYDRNAFVQFLFDLFPDCSEEINAVLKMYFVGTFDDYTCFPQIDRLNRVCKAKLIRFNRANGKRLKGDFDTSSLKTKLKLKADFNYKQIFFGEHLLPKYPNKPAAIVEAEKTAIIASLCFPERLWLATGSKQWLKAERLNRLDGRQIILYPDADGFDLWQGIALDAQRQGLTVKASSLIENHATAAQKENGYDLADYLINQQREINESNEVYDAYNSKVDLILNDDSLLNGFDLFLEERKAIAIYNGASETDAERICTQPENLRSVIMSI